MTAFDTYCHRGRVQRNSRVREFSLQPNSRTCAYSISRTRMSCQQDLVYEEARNLLRPSRFETHTRTRLGFLRDKSLLTTNMIHLDCPALLPIFSDRRVLLTTHDARRPAAVSILKRRIISLCPRICILGGVLSSESRCHERGEQQPGVFHSPQELLRKLQRFKLVSREQTRLLQASVIKLGECIARRANTRNRVGLGGS